jgi:hypothetical protein
MQWAIRLDNKHVINVREPQQWFLLRKVKSQFSKMLHLDGNNDG